MSLSRLSTEIDESAVSFLPSSALSNLSKTSKYYRALAEPHLYRDLHFSIHESLNVFRLFLTILKRSDLAAHIRSSWLSTGHRDAIEDTRVSTSTEDTDNDEQKSSQAFTTGICNAVLEMMTPIGELVKKLATPMNNPGFTLKWYGSILDASYGEPAFDAVLPLMWCLATNLENLSHKRVLSCIGQGGPAIPLDIDKRRGSSLSIPQSEVPRHLRRL